MSPSPSRQQSPRALLYDAVVSPRVPSTFSLCSEARRRATVSVFRRDLPSVRRCSEDECLVRQFGEHLQERFKVNERSRSITKPTPAQWQCHAYASLTSRVRVPARAAQAWPFWLFSEWAVVPPVMDSRCPVRSHPCHACATMARARTSVTPLLGALSAGNRSRSVFLLHLSP